MKVGGVPVAKKAEPAMRVECLVRGGYAVAWTAVCALEPQLFVEGCVKRDEETTSAKAGGVWQEPQPSVVSCISVTRKNTSVQASVQMSSLRMGRLVLAKPVFDGLHTYGLLLRASTLSSLLRKSVGL